MSVMQLVTRSGSGSVVCQQEQGKQGNQKRRSEQQESFGAIALVGESLLTTQPFHQL